MLINHGLTVVHALVLFSGLVTSLRGTVLKRQVCVAFIVLGPRAHVVDAVFVS
jgi:hypothetical protein